MQGRHLRAPVACHACGQTTHPAGKLAHAATALARRDGRACANCGQSIGKLQVVCQWLGQTVCHPCHTRLSFESAIVASSKTAKAASPALMVAPPEPSRESIPSGLELSAAPLVPLMMVGMTGAAFFVAVSLMSYVGGFVSALILVAVAAVGLRWVRRGTMSVRARLDQIELLRLRHGTLRLLQMLLAWLWTQPARRKPAAVALVLMWGALYTPYFVSAVLLFTPRPRAIHLRA